jgi:hypothetical protein
MNSDEPAEIRGNFKTLQSKLAGLLARVKLANTMALADQFTLLRGISHTTGVHPWRAGLHRDQ